MMKPVSVPKPKAVGAMSTYKAYLRRLGRTRHVRNAMAPRAAKGTCRRLAPSFAFMRSGQVSKLLLPLPNRASLQQMERRKFENRAWKQLLCNLQHAAFYEIARSCLS